MLLNGLNDPSRLLSEDVDQSLIVDYNESTSLSSPHRSDGHIEHMGKGDGAVMPFQNSHIALNMKTSSVTNATDSSSGLASSATIHESTAHEGAAASQLGRTSTPVIQTNIRVCLRKA